MECFVGLDIGSSSIKAGLLSPDGSVVGIVRSCYENTEPKPGFKEQDPEIWWRAAIETLRRLMAEAPGHEIKAVGIAGHISSMTFVDDQGRALGNAVGFQDRRSQAEVDEIASRFSRAELAGHLGIDLPAAPTWPLPRLLWFHRHAPRTLEQARHLLQAKDFVNHRLTGQFASDASSCRGLVNLGTGCPAVPLLRALGLRTDLLPPLLPPEAVIGTVTETAAGATGLPAGIPVVAGWNDLNASVLGCGAVEPGNAFNVTGTSEHLGVVTTEGHAVPELVCAPFLPGRHLLYGVTSCGGGSLDWYARAFGGDLGELVRAAEPMEAGAGGLLFLPYLEGERSPIWDSSAAGVFFGIRSKHDSRHFTRAILEGVAFSLLQIKELVEAASGPFSPPLVLAGGGAEIALWNRIKASVLGITTTLRENRQAGLLGAAMLAAVGSGFFPSLECAARCMTRPGEIFETVPEDNAVYRAVYPTFCGLYPALRGSFERNHAARAHG